MAGLDKMTGFYTDFLEAAAYRGADSRLGLPYLSPRRHRAGYTVEPRRRAPQRRAINAPAIRPRLRLG